MFGGVSAKCWQKGLWKTGRRIWLRRGLREGGVWPLIGLAHWARGTEAGPSLGTPPAAATPKPPTPSLWLCSPLQPPVQPSQGCLSHLGGIQHPHPMSPCTLLPCMDLTAPYSSPPPSRGIPIPLRAPTRDEERGQPPAYPQPHSHLCHAARSPGTAF